MVADMRHTCSGRGRDLDSRRRCERRARWRAARVRRTEGARRDEHGLVACGPAAQRRFGRGPAVRRRVARGPAVRRRLACGLLALGRSSAVVSQHTPAVARRPAA
eukprot:2969142-Prymnesium_polylepis.1